MKKTKAKQKKFIYRSTKNGKFVSSAYAKRYPKSVYKTEVK